MNRNCSNPVDEELSTTTGWRRSARIPTGSASAPSRTFRPRQRAGSCCMSVMRSSTSGTAPTPTPTGTRPTAARRPTRTRSPPPTSTGLATRPGACISAVPTQPRPCSRALPSTVAGRGSGALTVAEDGGAPLSADLELGLAFVPNSLARAEHSKRGGPRSTPGASLVAGSQSDPARHHGPRRRTEAGLEGKLVTWSRHVCRSPDVHPAGGRRRDHQYAWETKSAAPR